MSVLFLSADLVFSSRLAAAAERQGITLTTVSSIDAAIALLAAQDVRLIILDLSNPGLEPETEVVRLREACPGLAVVAYAPHVHEDRLRAAAAAGFNEVLSRGQFDRQMDDLLKRYAR
jgi:CheY-like chemotaxis protein